MTRVFWCEPTGIETIWLRRYQFSDNLKACPIHGYHNAMNVVGDIPEDKDEEGYLKHPSPDEYKGDQRWPLLCECGYAFTEKDTYQIFGRSLYHRADDPSFLPRPWEDMPAGAMRDCWWMKHRKGPDGISLEVKLPPDGHGWMPEQRASNCTLPEDNVHRCWVRHGDAKNGIVHVDKSGHTCAAGAGSIDTGKWHGFLHNNHLVQC